MTILSICQDALKEIGGWEVPDSIVENNNDTAINILALLKREGARLEKRYRWVQLITEGTITTTASTASYSKPSDFRRFANESQWDRTNNLEMNGPTNPQQWQFLKSSVSNESGTINRWFRIKGSLIYIHPTPDSTGDTLAFDYYSTNWLTIQSTGLPGSTIMSDNDTPLLDEDLLTLGVKWRFLKAKGIPWEAEYKEYIDLLDSLQAQDGGNPILRMDRDALSGLGTNVPDQGFGL